MQTLGLDGRPPSQPWYKLWVWPAVDSPEDAVSAARNGAIGSAAIGTMTIVILTLAGQFAGGLLAGGFFLLAGAGIRNLSFPASATAALLFLLNMVAELRMGRMPGVIGLALSLLLIGGVRASFRYLSRTGEERAAVAWDAPPGLEPWTQRAMGLIDSRYWKQVKIVFNILLFLYFALLFTGTVFVIISPDAALS